MDLKRQGELARACCLDVLRKRGIALDQTLLREVGDSTKRLNTLDPNLKAKQKEVAEFLMILCDELFAGFKERITKQIKSLE